MPRTATREPVDIMAADDPELRQQFIEANVEMVKDAGFSTEFFSPGGDVGDALYNGKMLVTKTQTNRTRVYHRVTGEASDLLTSQLAKHLAKKLPDGRSVFVLQRTVEPERGNDLCWLHPDHPMAAELAEIGIDSQCLRNDGTPSPKRFRGAAQVRKHMQAKHPRELKDIEEARNRAREERMLEVQTASLAAMQALAQKAG